jgi:predicted PurR-regulated permease PerM
MGLYCIASMSWCRRIDGNIIVPMVAKKTADLAPALVLGAQLILGCCSASSGWRWPIRSWR